MKKLRSLLCIAVMTLATVTSVAADMEIACNLQGNTDYADNEAFVDLFKMSRTWHFIELSNSDDWPHNQNPKPIDGIPVDENGWPLEVPFTKGGKQMRVCTTVLNGRHKKAFDFGTWTLLFEGAGEIRFSHLYEATITHDGNGVKKYPFDLGPEIFGTDSISKAMRINIYRSDKANPIRNIKLIRPGYLANDKYLKQPFTDEFVKDHRLFTVLRFMNWNETNNAELSKWKDRRPMNWATQASSPSPYHGVAYEWQIEAANTVGRDLWICLPHKADDEHITELAKLIKARLNKNLKCYIEYSNETWNYGSFSQGHWGALEWLKLYPGTDYEEAIQSWTIYRTAKMVQIFDQVFGSEKERIVSVLCGRFWSTGWQSSMCSLIDDARANPDKVTFDAFGLAPYFGKNVLNTDKTVAAVIAKFRDHLKDVKSKMESNVKTIKAAGLTPICYEGGTHADRGAWMEANGVPEIYDVYKEYLTILENAGCEMFNQFTSVARWNAHGAWGSKRFAGEDVATAHKYRALLDWAVARNQFDPDEEYTPGTTAITRGTVPSVAAAGFSLRRRAGRLVVSPQQQRGTFSILSLNGTTVTTRTYSGHGPLSIDLSAICTPGMYIGSFRAAGTVASRRFMVP